MIENLIVLSFFQISRNDRLEKGQLHTIEQVIIISQSASTPKILFSHKYD